MSQGAVWSLVAMGGVLNGRILVLTEQGISMGRSDECELALASQNVSRKHARFFIYQDLPYVQDLGSRNGVFVNGTRVQQQGLQPGDVITLGEFSFQLISGDQPATSGSGSRRKLVMIAGGVGLVVVLIAAVAVMSSGPSEPASDQARRVGTTVSSDKPNIFDDGNSAVKKGATAPSNRGAASEQSPQAPATGAGDPRNAVRDYLDRAELLQEAGKYQEAREQFEKALSLDPSCQLCLSRRERLDREVAGRVQKHMDDGMKAYKALRYDAAINYWEQALNLSPDPESAGHQQATKYIGEAKAMMEHQPEY